MANWHYFNENREKVGPITGRELKQLVQQGTITRETFVEDPNGRTGLAKDVKGLTFPEMPQPEPEELFIATPPPPIQTAQAVPVPPPVAKPCFCTNCGNSVAEQAVACMSCGAKPVGHKKFCRQCGVGLNPEQVVCIKCGSAINTGGVNVAGWMQSTVQSVGGNTHQLSNFLHTNNVTTGEIIIFIAAALAFLSFMLPWIEATVPLAGTFSKNGFSIYAFFLGLLFIHPVWMALTKKRTLHYKVRGYVWAGIGIVVGMVFPRVSIEVEMHKIDGILQEAGVLQGAEFLQEAARALISVGACSYTFIGACLALIIGMALQPRPSGDTKTIFEVAGCAVPRVRWWAVGFIPLMLLVFLVCRSLSAFPIFLLSMGVAVLFVVTLLIFLFQPERDDRKDS